LGVEEQEGKKMGNEQRAMSNGRKVYVSLWHGCLFIALSFFPGSGLKKTFRIPNSEFRILSLLILLFRIPNSEFRIY